MSFFRSLFSFSKQEVSSSFNSVNQSLKIDGLKLLKSKEDFCKEHGKLLIIVPKKVGKAFLRNKIRRQVMEIFYTKKLYQKKVTSILLVYPNATKLKFKDFESFLVSSI